MIEDVRKEGRKEGRTGVRIHRRLAPQWSRRSHQLERENGKGPTGKYLCTAISQVN